MSWPEAGICNAWLAEGRILCHEWLTEDGENFYCAHCGKTPDGPETVPFDEAMKAGFGDSAE